MPSRPLASSEVLPKVFSTLSALSTDETTSPPVILANCKKSVTLGEASTNLADTIVAQDKAINAKADTSDLEAAAASASAWITGNKGGYVVLRRNADGQP